MSQSSYEAGPHEPAKKGGPSALGPGGAIVGERALWPRAALVLAAMLFSTGGLAIKSCSLTDWQVAGFRSGVAGLTLLLLVPAARRGWSRRIWPVGLVYALTLICYVLANKATTSANAIFLQSAAPLYLLVLAPLLLRERIRRSDLALGLAMIGGLVLLLSASAPSTPSAPDPRTGNLYGLFAGLFWASTVLGLRWLAVRGPSRAGLPAGDDTASTDDASSADDGLRAVVAGNAIAFFGTLPMSLGPFLAGQAGPLAGSSPSDWGWILYLGVIQIGVAYLLLTRAMAVVPAFEASILLLVEPVFTPLWTWWFLGERAAAATWVGGGVILLATTVKTWVDFRPERSPQSP